MWSSLVVIATTIVLWTPRTAGSLTSGFPSLDDIKGNASLLDKYTTYDGEMRSIPMLSVSASQECSTQNVTITRIIFIALPRAGSEDVDKYTELIITTTSGSNHTISLNEANLSFGHFGYELEPSEILNLSDIDMFWIVQPYYKDSSLRLLHQMGDKTFNITWWRSVDDSDNHYNDTTYDYPLLAIETDPAGCIEGLVNESELRNMWEYRPPPVRYTSPYREIPLVCSGTGSVNRILAGAYSAMSGYQPPHIQFGGNDHVCNLSTLTDDEDPNVYECMLDSPPVDSVSLYVHQIVFLYDGEKDFPFIFIDITGDGECSSSGFISEDELRANVSLYIPQFVFLDNDRILFMQLIIKQPGDLVKWTFIAKNVEGNTEYPSLFVHRGSQRVFNSMSFQPFLTNYTNVYECIIDTPFQVQAGDIIGLDLPRNARLLLSIILNHGSFGGMSLRHGQTVEGLPLVTLEIDPLPVTIGRYILSASPSVSVASPTNKPVILSASPSVSVASPTEEGSSNNKLLSVMLGVSGSVLVLTLVTLVVVISLAVCLKQRKTKRKAFITTDNVAYTINEPVQLSPSFNDSGSFKHSETLYDYVSNTNAKEEDSRFVTVQNEAYAVTADNQHVSETGGLASETLYDYVSTTTAREEDSRFVTFQNEAYAVTADNQHVSETGGWATTIAN